MKKHASGSNYRQILGGLLKQKKNKFLFVTLILLILNISFLSIFKQEKTILQEQTKDSYLAIYLEEEQINYIPKKDSGYVLDLEKSNCSHGVTLDFDSENWFIKTNFTNYSNTDNTRVKCSLYFKQKDVTVNFQMPNLLPEYNNSKWVFTSGLGVSVNANNYYDTTSIQFNTHSSFQSNALYLILLDETGTNILENIASFGSNTQARDKIYEFTHETGQYTLETRLNGSKQDIKYLDSFSFTKGKKYKLQADVSVSEDRLTWNIENFALYENVESQTIKPGTTVSKPEVSVTKKGYTLSDDWYTNKERTEKFDFQTPITQDMTLYAAWTANTYTITYNANGGSGAPASQSYTYDANGTINLSSTKPTRAGYTFLGWSLSPTATSPSYTAGQAWKRSNASNYTLYAVWKSSYSTSTATYSGGIFVVGADGYIIAGQPGVSGAGWNLTRNNISGGTLSWNGSYSSLRANTDCTVSISGSISARPTDGYIWYTYRATLFIDGVNQGDLWWTGEEASAGGAGKSTTISRTISVKAGQTFEIRLSGGHDDDTDDRTNYSFSFKFVATPK